MAGRCWLRYAAYAEFFNGGEGFDVVEVVQIIPQERILLRIVEQIFDVPVPQVFVGILEVI